MTSDTKDAFPHCDLGICKLLTVGTFFSGLCIMHIYILTFISQITTAITTPAHIDVNNCVVMPLRSIVFSTISCSCIYLDFVSSWFNWTTSYIHLRSRVCYVPNNCDPAQGRDSKQCEMNEYIACNYLREWRKPDIKHLKRYDSCETNDHNRHGN